MLYISGEYRFPVHSILGIKAYGALFLDMGRVYSSFNRIALHDFHTSSGAGLRLIISPSVVGRIDIGLSAEGFGLYLVFGHPF